MFFVWYRDTPYAGTSVRDVFVKIWRDLGEKKKAIYSDDEREFLLNFFYSRSKDNFLGEKLKEKGFLQPEYFFAFGEITETIQIDRKSSSKAELDKIDEATRNLKQIMPDNFPLMSREQESAEPNDIGIS
jgi:hypothetical protein